MSEAAEERIPAANPHAAAAERPYSAPAEPRYTHVDAPAQGGVPTSSVADSSCQAAASVQQAPAQQAGIPVRQVPAQQAGIPVQQVPVQQAGIPVQQVPVQQTVPFPAQAVSPYAAAQNYAPAEPPTPEPQVPTKKPGKGKSIAIIVLLVLVALAGVYIAGLILKWSWLPFSQYATSTSSASQTASSATPTPQASTSAATSSTAASATSQATSGAATVTNVDANGNLTLTAILDLDGQDLADLIAKQGFTFQSDSTQTDTYGYFLKGGAVSDGSFFIYQGTSLSAAYSADDIRSAGTSKVDSGCVHCVFSKEHSYEDWLASQGVTVVKSQYFDAEDEYVALVEHGGAQYLVDEYASTAFANMNEATLMGDAQCQASLQMGVSDAYDAIIAKTSGSAVSATASTSVSAAE